MKTILIAAAVALSASIAFGDNAGLRVDQIDLPHHEQGTEMALWYPTEDFGSAETFANNLVFKGVLGHWDAAPTDGAHPIVLFSHGMGGGHHAQAWLAAGLAKRGAIVVMVNHPGSTWGDFDMTKGVAH